MTSAPMPLEPRRRFHLLARLGEGTYGQVFLAEQESHGGFRRRVALKVMRNQLGPAAGAEAARRMRDEARVLGLLTHRNIVRVLDLVQLEHSWALVMEPVDGPDLNLLLEAAQLDGSTVPARAALEIAAAVARALDSAWRADDGRGAALAVVHRDVKPGNILLTAEGDVRVLDFGVARMELEGREGHTGPLVGTQRYMSPERLLRDQDGPPGDVYALGATLAELVLGEPIGVSPLEATRHASFVYGVAGRVPFEPMADLIGSALAHDPGLRPTAAEFATTAEALALAVAGPSLLEFAHTFVPRVEALLGQQRRVATSGTLSESPTTAERTLVPPVAAVRSPGVTRWLLAAGLGGIFGAATGAVALFAVLGIVLVPLLSRAPPPDRPPPPSVEAPEPVPAAAMAPPEFAVRPPPAVHLASENVDEPPLEGVAEAEPVAEPAPAAHSEVEPDGVVPVLPTEPPLSSPVQPVEPVEPAEPVPAAEPFPAVPQPTASAPRPVAEPPPVVPALGGLWVGNAGGRPLLLRIREPQGQKVTATAEISQGPATRSAALEGAWRAEKLDLVGPNGERFVGSLEGATIRGEWTARAGAPARTFTATLR